MAIMAPKNPENIPNMIPDFWLDNRFEIFLKFIFSERIILKEKMITKKPITFFKLSVLRLFKRNIPNKVPGIKPIKSVKIFL